MNADYQSGIHQLRKALPFLKKIALIKGKQNILYKSKDWNLIKDLKTIKTLWESMNPAPINLSGVRFIVRRATYERFIASAKGKSHLIGVRNAKYIALVWIEEDGIIPFTTRELSRFLGALMINKPYYYRNCPSKPVKRRDKIETTSKTSEVPFTARLMAHYRAQESKREKPLIIDPYASSLAGDLENYLNTHIRHSLMDYPIVRSLYVEEKLLIPWCKNNTTSQIVILGSGLTSRPYRFKSLSANNHTVFEIDFPDIIRYKEKILENETPLTILKRIGADLSNPYWIEKLKAKGFLHEVPTYWTLEGLVYYLEMDTVSSLLRELNRLSPKGSKVFLDVLQHSRWLKSDDPLYLNTVESFTKHFKWGLDIREVPKFLSNLGWEVSCSFADDHASGKDVGQKAMIFVQGNRQA